MSTIKKSLVLFLLITNNCSALVDVTITSNPMDRAVNAAIHSHTGGGFFCEFGKVIASLIHYEQDGIKSMKVDWTHQFFPFKDGIHENGWDLYFEPIKTESNNIDPNEPVYEHGQCTTHELHDQQCVAQWLRYDEYLPYRKAAHDIINKYIRIKPHILNQVESFYQEQMKDHFCIGVHVRYAIMHEREAVHPPLEEYFQEVDSLLKAHKEKNVRIFLASDSHSVVGDFRKRYGDTLVAIDAYRAQDKEDPSLMYSNPAFWAAHPQIWHKEKPGYNGGVGTLIDCLLLSKCEYLIHITSNVATHACFFNPHIKSIYLPRNTPFKHCRHRGDRKIRNKFLNPI